MTGVGEPIPNVPLFYISIFVVKPESGPGSLNHLSRSIGNALLNLASLGSLAALQNAIPSSHPHHPHPSFNNNSSSNNNNTSSSTGGGGGGSSGPKSPTSSSCTSLLPPSSMTPLNLTNGNGSNSSNGGNGLATNITNALAGSSYSYLAQYISQQQHQQNSSSSTNGPNPSFLSPNNPNGNNLPQLILASGSIVQGIQGAQLLIPTAQGEKL